MTQYYKVIKLPHLVDLCGMVALMAVDAAMHTNYPCLVGCIMDMADRTSIGIVLEVIVYFVGGKEDPH